MKKTFRNTFAALFAYLISGLQLDKRAIKQLLNSESILPLYFHNPSKEEFLTSIKYLKNNGFNFIGLEDFEKIATGKLPFPKGSVFITVDDGWASNYENMVEVAENEKVPITIFATTEAIEEGNYWFNYAKKATKLALGYPSKESLKKHSNSDRLIIMEKIKNEVSLDREAMSISQLQIIDKLHFVRIEAHSHIHPILPNCTDSELKADVIKCKELLENWLNRPVTSFAYPNGDFGEREMALLKNSGFILGFGNSPSILSPAHLQNLFGIPRIGFLEGASRVENQCRMLGIWHKYTFRLFKK